MTRNVFDFWIAPDPRHLRSRRAVNCNISRCLWAVLPVLLCNRHFSIQNGESGNEKCRRRQILEEDFPGVQLETPLFLPNKYPVMLFNVKSDIFIILLKYKNPELSLGFIRVSDSSIILRLSF